MGPGYSDPTPHLRAYPRETVVAEKLEAMVQLSMTNSRMKDFYDVAVLAKSFDFDGERLVRAIRATFERRRTPLPPWPPVAFTPVFADDATKRGQWSGFARRAGISDVGSLAEAVTAAAAFLEEPVRAASQGTPFAFSPDRHF
jgi:hypothetical protein